MSKRPVEVKACCIPSRGLGGVIGALQLQRTESDSDLSPRGVSIPGGEGLVGTRSSQIADDGEGPLRRVPIKGFRMAQTTVTNAEFRAFVTATGFVSEAEKFGWSFVFHSQLSRGNQSSNGVVGAEWWRRVDGASWAAPFGPGSECRCLENHPAVHISWNDAQAYCDWIGGRLPREEEWEHAARGGLGDVRFPWGNKEPNDHDFTPCNIWQGQFPNDNTGLDGFQDTCPAESFEPNGYGLFNLVGNVWEWTQDNYDVQSQKHEVKKRLRAMKGYKVSKGGSFLCHRSYCYRYRIAARSGTSPDSTASHQGFRVVWDS